MQYDDGMFVVYKCDECDTDVNSRMDYCPSCGEELPVFSLDESYVEELEAEYAREHPILARLESFIDQYTDHIDAILADDKEISHEAHIRKEAFRAKHGRFISSLVSIVRGLLFVLLVLLYFVGIGLFAETFVVDEVPLTLLYVVFVALLPLYLFSLWQIVSRDQRDIPLGKKILYSLLGALNKLFFALLLVFCYFFTITLFTRYLGS